MEEKKCTSRWTARTVGAHGVCSRGLRRCPCSPNGRAAGFTASSSSSSSSPSSSSASDFARWNGTRDRWVLLAREPFHSSFFVSIVAPMFVLLPTTTVRHLFPATPVSFDSYGCYPCCRGRTVMGARYQRLDGDAQGGFGGCLRELRHVLSVASLCRWCYGLFYRCFNTCF